MSVFPPSIAVVCTSRTVRCWSATGAIDDAEDDLLDLLQRVLGPEVVVRWEQDVSHPNPWFHTLILDVSDGPGEFSHAQHTALMAGLRALDLA